MKDEFSPAQQAFLDEFSTLPPVIARHEVSYFLGGLVSRKTLANADAAGKGPEIAYAVGRHVAYRTHSLLLWVLKNYEITELARLHRTADAAKCRHNPKSKS